MRRIKHILSLAALLLCCISVSAHDFSVGGIYYKIISSADCTVAVTYAGEDYESQSTRYYRNVSIPSSVTYNGTTYRVTSIGSYAFYDCGELTSVSIPKSVTEIEYYAFAWCSSLKSITIPEDSKLTSIRSYAFEGCSSLTSIIIPEGVTEIEYYAFYACSSLTSIIIPNGVTSIDRYAFYGCSSLTSITCKAVTPPTIGSSNTFYNVDKSIPVYVPASSVAAYKSAQYWSEFTNIQPIIASGTCGKNLTWKLSGEYELIIEGTGTMYGFTSTDVPWFEYRESINSVVIAEGVTSIGSNAFCNTAITQITIPASLTSLSSSAFTGCGQLEAINVKNGNKTFESIDGVVYNEAKTMLVSYPPGKKSTTFTIPSGNTSLGSNFIDSDYLTDIYIPSTVTTINPSAFNKCTSLMNIHVDSKNTGYLDRDGVLYYYYNYSGTTVLELNSLPLARTSLTLANDVTGVYIESLHYNEKLKSVIIADGANKLGLKVYSNDTSEKYDKGNGWAFENAPLKNVYIGRNLNFRNIYTNAIFVGNASVESVEFGKYVTSIPASFLKNCTGLSHIALNGELETLGASAFDNTYLDNNTKYENGVKYIFNNKYAYSIASDATDVIIKEGTKLMASGLFERKNVVSVVLPGSLGAISASAFRDCAKLESVTISNGITSIGSSAFSHCSALKNITIPQSVTSVGNFCFFACYALASVVFEDGDETLLLGNSKYSDGVGGGLFEYLYNLTDVYIGRNLSFSNNNDSYNRPSTNALFAHWWNGSSAAVKTITIGPKVTQLAPAMFNGCLKLESIICQAPSALAYEIGYYNYYYEFDKAKCVLYVPSNLIDAYKSAEYWNEFTNILPLPITITINQYGSGTYSSPYALDFRDVKGLYAYAGTGYNSEDGVVTFTRVKTAKAGTGLFIKGAPNTSYEVPVLESTADNTLNMLVATLEKTPVNAYSSNELYANYRYTIKASDAEPKFYQFADGSTLSAGKAYLQIPVAWLPGNETRSIRFRFDDGDGEDVDDGTTEMDNTEFGIQNSEIIYDLMGRRVASPQRGSLYIINGKKVIY